MISIINYLILINLSFIKLNKLFNQCNQNVFLDLCLLRWTSLVEQVLHLLYFVILDLFR